MKTGNNGRSKKCNTNAHAPREGDWSAGNIEGQLYYTRVFKSKGEDQELMQCSCGSTIPRCNSTGHNIGMKVAAGKAVRQEVTRLLSEIPNKYQKRHQCEEGEEPKELDD